MTEYTITSIKIHDIEIELERLEDHENEATDLKGAPVSRDFWQSPSLKELAFSQGVQSMADVRALFGTWPDTQDDGFQAAIDELRHQSLAGRDPR